MTPKMKEIKALADQGKTPAEIIKALKVSATSVRVATQFGGSWAKFDAQNGRDKSQKTNTVAKPLPKTATTGIHSESFHLIETISTQLENEKGIAPNVKVRFMKTLLKETMALRS